MKKKIYISGPISGHDLEERRKAFALAQKRCEEAGYDVFNPMSNGLPANSSTAEHMKRDLETLLQCDSIYMMNGWNHSAGCHTEFVVATSIGCSFVFESLAYCEEENGKYITKLKFQ